MGLPAKGLSQFEGALVEQIRRELSSPRAWDPLDTPRAKACKLVHQALAAYVPAQSRYEVEVTDGRQRVLPVASSILAELSAADEAAWRLGAFPFAAFLFDKGTASASVGVAREAGPRSDRMSFWRCTHALGRMTDQQVDRLVWDLRALRLSDWGGGVRVGQLYGVDSDRLRPASDPDWGRIAVKIKLRIPAAPRELILQIDDVRMR